MSDVCIFVCATLFIEQKILQYNINKFITEEFIVYTHTCIHIDIIPHFVTYSYSCTCT